VQLVCDAFHSPPSSAEVKNEWDLYLLFYPKVPSQHVLGTAKKMLIHYCSCEGSGSHGNEYEDGCLLGCCAVWCGGSLLTFQRYLLSLSSM
jgi:hypothetical protein